MAHSSRHYLLFLLCIFFPLQVYAADQQALVVGIDTVSVSAYQEKVKAIGTIAAREAITLASRVTGFIEALHIADGQMVQAGQQLIVLDRRFEQAKFNEIKAKYHEELRRLRELEHLVAKKAASQSELDAQKSLVTQSEAMLQAAGVTLDYYSINAPFSGVLGMNQLSKGEYIQAGNPLVRLVNLDSLYVDFNLSSRYLSKIKVGQNLLLSFEAWLGKQFTAEVSGIDPVIDTDSRNLKIRANIKNNEYLLLPGLLADISLTLFSYNALAIKTSSVFYKEGETYVYRVSADDKAVICPVSTGKEDGDTILILSGLSVGDRVISKGVIKVKEGVEVVSDSVPDMNHSGTTLHKNLNKRGA